MISKIRFISDFNISILARYINSRSLTTHYDSVEEAYGQVLSILSNPDDVEITSNDLSFVWARPESISGAYSKALNFTASDEQECIEDIEYFGDLLIEHSKKYRFCFVASFGLPLDHSGYGILDWQLGVGLTRLVSLLNIKLTEKLASEKNIFVLDANRWFLESKSGSLPKMWYATKVPYPNDVFQLAADDLERAITTIDGFSKRIIFLDLDNTLWGGVVGENGWPGVRLGGHDHIGEAFKDFQHKLKALTLRGVQLALVSKNEEDVALEAIDKHPEMVLKRSDFAAWRINWGDKAQNIVDILAEINLGEASAVFIDDNPVERGRVRSALPEVYVPEWPEDPCLYVKTLNHLRCFDSISISAEDRSRTKMYVDNKARRTLQSKSMDSWLVELGTVVKVEELGEANIARVSQLLNKTNQLNLSTRRLTAEQLKNWSGGVNCRTIACSVSDKFGDLGLTGIVSVEVKGDQAYLVDYILSCRVMGRVVEATLIYLAINLANELLAKELHVLYLPTERNMPTLKVLKTSSLSEIRDNQFLWDFSSKFDLPSHIRIEQSKPVEVDNELN